MALTTSIPELLVSQYRTGNIQPPHAVVGLTSGTYDSTMGRGSDDLSVQVVVYASRADDPDGQLILDEFVAGHGARSVKTILEDTSLSELSSAMVRVRRYELGTSSGPDGVEYLVASFEVQAVVSGVS